MRPVTATPAAASTLDRKANPAKALARVGGLLGGCLAVAVAADGSGASGTWRGDLPWMALFAASSLSIVLLGAWVLDLVFLGVRGATVSTEIARGNVAAGVVRGGHRVAMGVVAASCLYGADLRTLAVSAAFAGLGLGTLLIFQALHRLLTRYADDQEVRGQNVAAALGSAGLTLALAIIVGHAAEGTFTGWADSLRGYGLALLLAAGLYPVRQLLVKKLLLGFPLSLRGRLLDKAIAEERDAVVGAAEGLSYLAMALLVTGLL
jgi:uncharacterized membrane protein YjfL (UPF0719 family)